MKVFYFFILFVLSLSSANAQARLVLNNGGWIVMNNGIYLVVDNGNPDAITQTGTKGYIHSESETNRVKWNIGANTGIYNFPFKRAGQTDENTFWMNKTTAGTGAGSYTISSWYTASNATAPSGGYTVCPDENNAIDRFWVISLAGYTANPTADIRFYYNANELDAIPEADLQAQRGNLTLTCPWEVPVGTVNTTNKYVEVTGVSNFSPWALANRNNPLPITLLSFTGECKERKAVLRWETAVEINNDYFTIQRSVDGQNFENIGTKQGAGNSNTTTHYEFTDAELPTTNHQLLIFYYRLKQTDFDGSFSYSPIIAVQSCFANGGNSSATIYIGENKEVVIAIKSDSEKRYNVSFYNALGQNVHQEVLNITEGTNIHLLNPKKMATGVYMIILQAGEEYVITRKLFLH